MAEYIERQLAENELGKSMPRLETPDGRGERDYEIEIAQTAFVDAIVVIQRLPAADVVPVVRCRDCRFIIDRDDGTHGCYRHFVDECEPDDFCSYGERSTIDGLKPCPLCGSQNIGIVYTRANGIPSGDNGWRAEIKCKCGANMKFWALEKSWAKESITKAWNCRPGKEDQDG